jgi:hypothetical protein
MDEDEALRFDYGETTQVIRQLSDIRFRLLALVPTIAAAAVGLLSKPASPLQRFAVGIVGFVATLGIFVYELRNSQIHDAAVGRASFLEQRLGLPSARGATTPGGIYSERPATSVRLLGFLPVWRDTGLALVYAVALAAWAYLIVWGFLALEHASHAARWGALAGLVVGVVVLVQMARLSNTRER